MSAAPWAHTVDAIHLAATVSSDRAARLRILAVRMAAAAADEFTADIALSAARDRDAAEEEAARCARDAAALDAATAVLVSAGVDMSRAPPWRRTEMAREVTRRQRAGRPRREVRL